MNEILNLLDVIRKYRVSLTILVLGSGIAGVVIALVLPETFRAQAVLSPVESSSAGASSALMSQIAGLPGLGSLGIAAGSSSVEENVAYLTSRSFTEEFIQENSLAAVINEGEEFESPAAEMWRAYKRFNLEIRRLVRDPVAGLATLSIEWRDPHVAAEWANMYVAKANDDLRRQALERAERNLAFANAQLEKTTVVELRQAVFRLIETEIRSSMLAQAQEEFAFRVVDRALPPGERYRPRRAMLVIVFGLIGGFLGALFIIVAELAQLAKADRSSRNEL